MIEGNGWSFAPEDLLLSSGRACVAKFLACMRPELIHVPAFICDSVLLPMKEAGIAYRFYPVDAQLCPRGSLEPGPRDAVLFVDYFGMRSAEVLAAAAPFADRAIIDQSQCCYRTPIAGCWSFDSLRKFFPLPDGARLHAPMGVNAPRVANTAVILDHLIAGRSAEDGLEAYRRNNAGMHTAYVRMSTSGEGILKRLDVEGARRQRNVNVRVLHHGLEHKNTLHFDPATLDAPLYYPLLLDRPIDLHAVHKAGIFAPRLWPEVLSRGSEHQGAMDIAVRLLPLPIDQRYSEEDMNRLLCRLEPLI